MTTIRAKGIIILLCIALCSLSVLGTSKPVAGTITYSHGSAILPVIIHVEVTATGTPQECIVNPSVSTGLGGSFASNLDNLILKGAPTVRCNGLWASGNKIWYTFENHGVIYTSPQGFISSGTGLQVLIPTVLDATDLDITPSSPSTSGTSSGSSSTPTTDAQAKVIDNSPTTDTLPPKVEILLQSTPIDMQLKVTVFGRLITGTTGKAQLRVDILRIPDNNIISHQESEVTFPFSQDLTFDMTNFLSGQYKVQAVVYDESGHILGGSAPDTFNVRRPEQEIPESTNFAGHAFAFSGKARSFVESPYLALVAYFISFLLILVAVILFIYKRRHYAHEVPLDFIEVHKK